MEKRKAGRIKQRLTCELVMADPEFSDCFLVDYVRVYQKP